MSCLPTIFPGRAAPLARHFLLEDPVGRARCWMVMTEIITDAGLFERFATRRDGAAFAELVRRHGPMVRATCRRVLGERPEVDDAFQAVGVVLAQKPAAGNCRSAFPGRRE